MWNLLGDGALGMPVRGLSWLCYLRWECQSTEGGAISWIQNWMKRLEQTKNLCSLFFLPTVDTMWPSVWALLFCDFPTMEDYNLGLQVKYTFSLKGLLSKLFLSQQQETKIRQLPPKFSEMNKPLLDTGTRLMTQRGKLKVTGCAAWSQTSH